jgi:transcription initiation factor IIE alpha subunit
VEIIVLCNCGAEMEEYKSFEEGGEKIDTIFNCPKCGITVEVIDVEEKES